MTDISREAELSGEFFAERAKEIARIKAALEQSDHGDKEDIASYAGEVVQLRAALDAAEARPVTVQEAARVLLTEATNEAQEAINDLRVALTALAEGAPDAPDQ